MTEQQVGFELKVEGNDEATFFPLDTGSKLGGKELKIIDACTSMPLDLFADALDDPVQRRRGPMQMAMIALSIRTAKPEWSVERIMAIVDDLTLDDVTWLAPEEDAEAERPLSESNNNGNTESNSNGPSGESASGTPEMTSQTEMQYAEFSATQE